MEGSEVLKAGLVWTIREGRNMDIKTQVVANLPEFCYARSKYNPSSLAICVSIDD